MPSAARFNGSYSSYGAVQQPKCSRAGPDAQTGTGRRCRCLSGSALAPALVDLPLTALALTAGDGSVAAPAFAQKNPAAAGKYKGGVCKARMQAYPAPFFARFQAMSLCKRMLRRAGGGRARLLCVAAPKRLRESALVRRDAFAKEQPAATGAGDPGR